MYNLVLCFKNTNGLNLLNGAKFQYQPKQYCHTIYKAA
jgi:hypothetical protein